MVSSEKDWVDAAGARGAWMLWGKASPLPESAHPGHPLLCHMLDVVSVARAMLVEVLPEASRRRLLDPLQMERMAALAWLLFFIALHDLGKVTPAFQQKAPGFKTVLAAAGFDFDPPEPARDHGTVGVILGVELLGSELGIPEEVALPLMRCVAAHHGSFPRDIDGMKSASRREGGGARWKQARRDVFLELVDLFGVRNLPPLPSSLAHDHAFTVMLAGLTSVADWIGSMAERFPYCAPQPSAATYFEAAHERARTALDFIKMYAAPTPALRTFRELFENDPWPLHSAAETLSPSLDGASLVIIEAPMGEGKTEAALLLAEHLAARAGHGGLFIGLPTQATANQMFGRVQRFLDATHGDARSNLQLAHGEASLHAGFGALMRGIYDPDAPDGAGVRAERWFTSSKRTLLATHAVGTVDQALLAVLRAKHGFVRLFGLGGKVVVIDEVHAYDVFTSTLLDRLVAWLRASGASVLLLSATLPSRRRAELLRAAGVTAPELAASYPRITVARAGHASEVVFGSVRPPVPVTVRRLDDDVDAVADELVQRIADGGCAGWICNTVARAQRAFEVLRKHPSLPRDTRMILLHARLLAGDRSARERELEALLGRKGARPHRCIVVGTQVLEQSLDVDFDVLATDVAPIDLVLQRAGRLYRHVRPARPAAVTPATLLVVTPAGEPLAAPLAQVAIVYDEFVMRRTLLALEHRTRIDLPGDIEGLVETVYRPFDAATDGDVLAAVHARAEAEHRDDRLNALQRLMPMPDLRDDPFADFGTPYRDDDDPSLHEALRALTRLGDPSVDVVCLHRTPKGMAFDAKGTLLVDISRKPDRETVRRFMEHSVGIARRGLVQALLKEKPPGAWDDVGVLSHRRLVVFERGRCEAHGFVLRLDPVLGLIVEKTRKGAVQ